MCKILSMVRRVCAFMLIVTVLFVVAVPSASAASVDDGKFYVEVIDLEQTDEYLAVEIAYDNRCGNRISFGWVNSCDLVVKTDEGTYSTPLSSLLSGMKIGNGTCCFRVYDCKGKVETITFTELILLNSRDLPGRRIHDITVYDDGTSGYIYDFSFRLPKAIPVVFGVIFGSMIVTGGVILLIVLSKKKDATPAFSSNAGDFTALDTAQQMHQQHLQAHLQAVQMHQDFVDRTNHENFCHFAETTAQPPMDFGNFMPPTGF